MNKNYTINDRDKQDLLEIGVLLDSLQVKGSDNVFILAKILTNYRSIVNRISEFEAKLQTEQQNKKIEKDKQEIMK